MIEVAQLQAALTREAEALRQLIDAAPRRTPSRVQREVLKAAGRLDLVAQGLSLEIDDTEIDGRPIRWWVQLGRTAVFLSGTAVAAYAGAAGYAALEAGEANGASVAAVEACESVLGQPNPTLGLIDAIRHLGLWAESLAPTSNNLPAGAQYEVEGVTEIVRSRLAEAGYGPEVGSEALGFVDRVALALDGGEVGDREELGRAAQETVRSLEVVLGLFDGGARAG